METTTQIYLQLTLASGPLAGEAKAGGYEGRIDIESFNFNAQAKDQPLKTNSAKEIKNSVDFDPVTLVKVFDRSSLLLAGVLNRKEMFTEARISVDQQFIDPDWDGKVRNEILILTLRDGYVARMSLRTSEGNRGASIREDVQLSFNDYRVDYWAEDRDYNIGRLVGDYRWDYYGYDCVRPLQDA